MSWADVKRYVKVTRVDSQEKVEALVHIDFKNVENSYPRKEYVGRIYLWLLLPQYCLPRFSGLRSSSMFLSGDLVVPDIMTR